jgi:hypothetical protein
MATISPTISTAAPIVTIDTQESGVSYDQILASLGTMVYGAEMIYIYGATNQQIAQPFYYVHTDVNGNADQKFLPFSVDPFQTQTSLYYETTKEQIVFDGLSSLSFDLLANSTVYLKFYTQVEANRDLLDLHYNNLFVQVEDVEGVKFFHDFKDYLIDKEEEKPK